MVIGGSLTATLTTDELVVGRLTNDICMINNVDVSDTFLNNNDGTYIFTYTISQADSDQMSGDIPISCSLKDVEGQATTANSWTDGNTLAIDANKPVINSLTASPNPAKAGVLAIELLFSEPMDTNVLPIVEFGSFSENTTLSRGDGVWSADKIIWKETFDIIDTNIEKTAAKTIFGGRLFLIK